jgi:hypothetical protein
MATSKNTIKSFTIKVNTDNGKVKIEGVTKAYEAQEVAFKRLQNSVTSGTKEMTKANQHLQDATGSASASTLELGRVISDSNYGIRGVANNISQLGTNLASTYKKAGSLKGAFVALRGALMGPLGALLLFQTGIALLERWSMNQKKATDSLKEFNTSAAGAGSDLKIFKNQVDAGNVSNDELAKSLTAINDKYKDLNVEVDENGRLTDASTEAINRKIGGLEQLARASALQTVIEKQLAEQMELEIELMDAQTKRRKEFSDEEVKAAQDQANENMLQQMQNRTISQGLILGATYDPNLSGRQEDAYDSTKEEGIIETRLRKSRARIEEIMNMFGDNDLIDELFPVKENSGSKTRQRRLKIFKQNLLEFDKLILQNNRNQELVGVKFEEDKLEIQQKFADEDIRRKTKEFKEKQDKRLADYLEQIKDDANFKELKLKAEKKHSESIVMADVEKWEALESNALLYTRKIEEARRKEELKLQGLASDNFSRDVEDASGTGSNKEANQAIIDSAREAKMAEINARLDAEKEGSAAYMQIKREEAEFNKEIALEDIQTEIDKRKEQERINMEYVGFVSQMGTLLTNLGKRSKALAKIALAVEKGAAIAKVIVSANAAISARRDNHVKMPDTIPFGPYSIPNPAKQVDKITMAKDITRTKVGAGLSIANILATSISSKGNIGGGDSGGGQGGRTFDFNLVGSTGENQAAQTTASALNQPVQAYVVSSDITNQQQLDNNIQGQASFGED